MNCASVNPILPRFLLAPALLLASAMPQVQAQSDALLDLRDISTLQGDVAQGKAEASTCAACHGESGISVVPMFPNLAGQGAEYTYWRLVEVQREARADSPMTPLVANLDDAQMRNMAAWYASLEPAGFAGNMDNADHSAGRLLWLEGDAARGIPPCQGCHGTGAEGHALAAQSARWRVYPILRGQHAQYVMQRLKAYRDGRHTLTSSARIMQGVATNLDDASIQALAEWIETGNSKPASRQLE